MEKKKLTTMLVMNILVVSFDSYMNDIHGYEKYDFDEVSEEDKQESRC